MHWLVSIVARPIAAPRPASRRARERFDELLALWKTHIPAIDGDGSGDYEDFVEQAFRLEAALDSFGADNVWLVVSLDTDTAVNAGTGETRPVADLEHLPRYGVQPNRAHREIDMEQARLASAYYRYEAFRSRAARRLAVCGFGLEGRGVELGAVLADWSEEGVRRVFLKSVEAKQFAFATELPAAFRANQAGTLMYEELDCGAMWLDGLPESIIAQEFVPMEYEYRVFVVNRTVVAAAGCVEEFTPLDNNGFPFDHQLRRHRQAQSPVELAPEVAGILTGFARNAVDALAYEVPDLTDYVIDVALGPDGNPLIVELNSLLNSGLYASQPARVTEAMVATVPA